MALVVSSGDFFCFLDVENFTTQNYLISFRFLCVQADRQWII